MKGHHSYEFDPQDERNSQPQIPMLPPNGYGFSNSPKESLLFIMDNNANFNMYLKRPMAKQLSTALKIEEKTVSNHNDRVNKIKSKLVDIFLQEKDEWSEYLQLPKFKTLSEPTKQFVNQVMKEIWNEYKNKSGSEMDPTNQYMKYCCPSENPKEVQSFHLNMLQFIKGGFFFEGFGENDFFRQSMGNYHPSMMPPPRNPGEYPSFVPPEMSSNMEIRRPPGNFFDQQSYPGKVKVQQNYNQNMAAMNLGEQFPSVTVKKQHIQAYGPVVPKQEYIPPSNLPKKYAKKFNDQDSSKNNIKNNQKNEKQQAIYPVDRTFIGCACRGRISEEQRYFECDLCERRFHLRCINIPYDAKQKLDAKKVCPQCTLKHNNAFFETMGEPIDMFWSDDRQLHKQKITIKGKKCKQILQSKQLLQLKFLKVEGRKLFDFYVLDEEEKEQPQKKSALSQIIIREDMLLKGNGEDVKISLDCMKSQNRPMDINKKPVLLFVAIYAVRMKFKEEIIRENFAEVEQDYLDRILGDREEIKIQVMDSSLKLISTPARGIDCQHIHVFDLEQFVGHCIDLASDICFYCSKKCRSFKIDRKIQSQITKIKQQIEDPDSYPTEIYYTKNKQFRWGERQKEESPIISGEDNDISLSMSEQPNEEDIVKEENNDD